MTTTFQQPANGAYRPPATGVEGRYAALVTDAVKHASATAERSLQTQIGPSELGTPCLRRLGYRILDWPATNTDSDPWPALVGTSVHAQMAAIFAQRNAELGRE